MPRLWFESDTRDTPVEVQPDRVVCASGRVLAPRTGKRKWKGEPSEPADSPEPDVRIVMAAGGRHAWVTRLRLDRVPDDTDDADDTDDTVEPTVAWQCLVAGGDQHYLDSIVSGPWLHVLIADGPPIKRRGLLRVDTPVEQRLRTVDLRTGAVVLDCEISRMKRSAARIEWCDEDRLILSFERREIRAFRWR